MKLPLFFTNAYTRSRVWDDVCAWFNPRQKWLTDVIPNTWCDKTELIPRVLFICLVDFVDNEKGLDQLNVDWSSDLAAGYITQEYVDEVNSKYGLLKEVYDYIKTERHQLHIDLDAAYPPMPDLFTKRTVTMEEGSYEKLYGEVNRIEKLIEEKDQWAMKAIVEHVGILWT
jgi:hypothetical protein